MILLLGTKEEITDTEPIERPKFIEDMNEAELASAVLTSKIQTTTQWRNSYFSCHLEILFIYS